MRSGWTRLMPGGNGGGASVRRFTSVNAQVVVRKDGAPHGRHQDGGLPDAQLVNALREELVNDSVAAPGTVVVGDVREGFRSFVHQPRRSCFNGHMT